MTTKTIFFEEIYDNYDHSQTQDDVESIIYDSIFQSFLDCMIQEDFDDEIGDELRIRSSKLLKKYIETFKKDLTKELKELKELYKDVEDLTIVIES